MKLFLASRIKEESTILELEKYIGGFKNKKIALVPTASNGENGWGFYKTKLDGTWNFVHSTDAVVEDILLEDYRDETVMKKFENKDVIWLMGGMAGYLAYWMRRCKIDLYIKDILKKGTILVGSSAGAMVLGQTLQVSGWSISDGERGSENIEPVKLVDFDIFPHYKDEYFDKIKQKYSGKKIYLLKDGEEIIIDDDKFRLIGEERIITNE